MIETSTLPHDSASAAEASFAILFEELAERIKRGEPVDLEAAAREHPEHAERLCRLLPAVQLIAVVGSRASADGLSVPPGDQADNRGPLPEALGDFRILREVGRGGMGVVYEAEQLSLGRRVALKVLPLAATMDARHLQRFKNEAQAAAYLTHQNIVPVYFVGCDRGVHYYAMQFIDGHSLAEVIDQLRQERANLPNDPKGTTAYLPGRPAPAQGAEGGPVPAAAQATRAEREGKAETEAGSVTPASGLSRSAYFAWVARLGEQAALALEHAHQLGVLHRDIKPANLMLDGRGNLWVTDFGLAHLPGDQRLTMTGDFLGTLRYMSPEQALAQRVTVDQRTDVYSLGVTLYELLTLQPAYRGTDRQELLRQIAFEEPKAPRRLDEAIPVELETIVLKAMAKAPHERYATAQELADDLRHWLEDRPIRARRPPVWLQMRRWGRRHRPLVAAATAAALVGLLVAATGLVWRAQERATQRAAQAAKRQALTDIIEQALKDSAKWQEQRRLPEALSAAQRAEGLLAGAEVDEKLVQRVKRRVADLALVDRLQQLSLERGSAVRDEHFDRAAVDQAYQQEFRTAGLDVDAFSPDETAARMRALSVPVELAGALDSWANAVRSNHGRWQRLLGIACLADPDARRIAMRQALAAGDSATLRRLASAVDLPQLSPATIEALARALRAQDGAGPAAETILLAGQRSHPGDFWLNSELAVYYDNTSPRRRVEAVRFASVAVGLRPESPGAHINLGTTLYNEGRLEEAIAQFRETIHLKKDYAAAHFNLGNALYRKGRLNEAIAEYREAIRLKKDHLDAHHNLAHLLHDQGRLDEAIAECRELIRLKKDDAAEHCNLAAGLGEKGQLDEAIVELREAIRLKKDYAPAHNNLGNALWAKRRLDEAIAEYKEAIRLKKDYAEAHNNLGNALRDKGRLDEAIAEYREAIRLKKDDAAAHSNLGAALRDKGRLDEAIAEYKEAIRLKKDYAEAHNNLGNALCDKGRLDEAIAEYREAIRLKKDDAAAHYALGAGLGAKGQLDEAIAEYREAIHLKKDFAEARCELGQCFYEKGQLDEAIAEYREAIRLKNDLFEAHYNLGLALSDKGRLDEAIAEYREALRLKKDYAEARHNLAIALQEKGLDQHLADFLSGRAKPRDAAEMVGLAGLCELPYKALYAASAHWYAEAFAAQPKLADDLNAQHRYNAACAAAQAGCGKGKDATKGSMAERSRLRLQALAWLRADLDAYRRALEKGRQFPAPSVEKTLAHWLEDSDLAGVRNPAELATLPKLERDQWEKLWQDVEALRRRAARMPAAASAAGH